jgi:hypothetical protein
MPSDVSLLGDELLDRRDIYRPIDLSEQLGLCLRPLAVADRLDEQVAQSVALEQLAEDVIDLAAERLARLLQLLQQSAVDLALACVARAEVPEMADLDLPDAVNAAEPLLQAIGVP